MKDKIVKVEWEDAVFSQDYYDGENLQKFNPLPASTVGYLIRKDRKMVILSQTRFHEGVHLSDKFIHTIPRGMVTKITYLEAKGEE